MAEKKNSNEGEEIDDSDEIIERLDPIKLDESDKDVEDIDHLFVDDEITRDRSIDSLFDEERKNFQDDLKDEVQKALSQPVMSKASLYRMRMKEPSESALKGEIAQQKSVEEIWEEPIDETVESQNRKSVIVMCVLIALLSIAGGWAIWKSTHDERGNEEELIAQENEVKQRELEKQLLDTKLKKISDLMNQYFSAITVAQKCESIYKGDLITEQVQQYYSSKGGVQPISDYTIDHIIPANVDDGDVWEVFVSSEQSAEGRLKSYFVRLDDEGGYKVSWKADVCFQDDDVKKFIETRSKEAKVFRFEVKTLLKMATYNWGFKDTDYQVVRLSIPDSDIVFWGYVARGSTEQKMLNRFIELDLKNQVLNKETKHQFILKVRFLEDSPRENDQYILIEDVISRKWVNTAE